MYWLWTYLKTKAPNFHVVVAGELYRAATPTPKDLEHYKTQYFIKTWLDLRMPKDYDAEFLEAQTLVAKRLGINRISLPLDDFGVVSDEQIRVALEILTDKSKFPIVFGCVGARHRSGLLGCMFRMRVQGWHAEAAFKEAKSCGYYRHRHEKFDDRFMDLIGMPRN